MAHATWLAGGWDALSEEDKSKIREIYDYGMENIEAIYAPIGEGAGAVAVGACCGRMTATRATATPCVDYCERVRMDTIPDQEAAVLAHSVAELEQWRVNREIALAAGMGRGSSDEDSAGGSDTI